ncbi:chloroplastic group IIA intron splicing facilitator CRS1, chloroplastic-like isoform X2 [Durio zibethinus]|uniref:Chloroplastic group IIA intron splicing facilitator CRS1, chloroplastic-like isoform X2 n=1 Tax=Durio zibethinus TaxID=66656 RepID=A0A6P5YBF3_DURZI|nr:chloroplastic group IIA intron splicing facilitator CRS1, chloroplastic-like isoform X2 [Durio zibethinus]
MLAAVLTSLIPLSSSLNSNQNPSKTLRGNPSFNKNFEFSISENPNNGPIKMPTAPWMKAPLLLQPREMLNLSKPTTKKGSNRNAKAPDKALFGKESGVRGKKVTKKIIRNVEKLQRNAVLEDTQIGICEEFELGNWLEEIGRDGEAKKYDAKIPWLREEEKVMFRRMKKEKVLTQAEISLDEDLLERLRRKAMRMRKWVKVMKAGVTQAVVDEIRLAWGKNELVMVKFGVPLCRNMDRAREIVEMKTGGLVVWSKKDILVVYRGWTWIHGLTSKFSLMEYSSCFANGQEISSSAVSRLTSGNTINMSQEKSNLRALGRSLYREDREKESTPTSIYIKGDENNRTVVGSLYERETDRLLDGLGPRFIDWWMRKPLPVDADLLPEVVPGFRPPLRLSPPNTRSKLNEAELTYLRKLAHPLPFHFALGRNRNLEGLAAAILKLWEKSLIAKIAIKWGIQNIDNEQMAYDLKNLTGGILLLRNKFLIIFYRGKDFLPQGVANLVVEREMALRRCQLNEEGARVKVAETFQVADEPLAKSSTVGTLSEFHDIQAKFGDLEKENNELELQLEAQKENLERELRNQERKLSILNIKIEKSAKKLAKLNSSWQPAELDVDLEIIAEEERECLRKIGLKLHSCLVLGRRGVFNGVIEGVHQHWKHREVVKIITMQRVFVRVIHTAKLLVAESGGILVSIEKLKDGHAIIIYRGKNYRRPLKLMTDNLLTKREALQRSIELQKIGSLKFFAYQRRQAILDSELKLAELKKRRVGTLQGWQAAD